MPTISLRGITLGFDDVGDGPNVLLLVHGHPFNRSMWRPQLRGLHPPAWRIIAPDLRGYGESTVVPGVTTFDTFVEDLAALLDDLAIDRVVVGGLSMGGQIAMHFCLRYPARVRGLLLAATFPQPETDQGKQTRREMAERLLREGMESYAVDALPKMLGPRSIAALPAIASDVMAMMRATDPRGAAAALLGRADRPGYEPTLAAIEVPALVVVGSADAFTTREDAESMARLLRQSELLWLPDIGHMPNLEAEAQFNVALAGLLERVEQDEPTGV